MTIDYGRRFNSMIVRFDANHLYQDTNKLRAIGSANRPLMIGPSEPESPPSY